MTIYEVPGLRGLELWRGIARGMPRASRAEMQTLYRSIPEALYCVLRQNGG